MSDPKYACSIFCLGFAVGILNVGVGAVKLSCLVGCPKRLSFSLNAIDFVGAPLNICAMFLLKSVSFFSPAARVCLKRPSSSFAINARPNFDATPIHPASGSSFKPQIL